MEVTFLHKSAPPQEVGYYPVYRTLATEEWKMFLNAENMPMRFDAREDVLDWLMVYERDAGVETLRRKTVAHLVAAREALSELRGHTYEQSGYMHAISTVDTLLTALHRKEL